MSPLQLIEFQGHRLYLKRDDLLHPVIMGNKWRKLAPVLERCLLEQKKGILTFGGAFSNHLHAVAAAGPLYGLQTVGIVRGEFVDLENPTLAFAREQGMVLFPVPKKIYDAKSGALLEAIYAQFPDYFLLPEGGKTAESVNNCQVIAHEVLEQLGSEAQGELLYVAVPAGTGTTAAGVLSGLAGRGNVLVFPATATAKGMEGIEHLLNQTGQPWEAVLDYTFGGFVSNDPALLAFIKDFQAETGVLLDPIYTGKMLFGLIDRLKRGFFPPESTIMALHTGGLQGWAGFEERYGGM